MQMENSLTNNNSNLIEDDNRFEWTVEEQYAKERVDKHIAEVLADKSVSRSQVQDWVKTGAVLVNGKQVKHSLRIFR
jgi:23S rRNA pseudouridine1911/1915/1917 synthase